MRRAALALALVLAVTLGPGELAALTAFVRALSRDPQAPAPATPPAPGSPVAPGSR